MASFKPNRIVLALFAGAALAGLALAFPPPPVPDQANSAGIILSEPTSESYAGAVQINAAGGVLTVDGSSGASIDTMNGKLITAYTGRIDPDFRGRNAAGIVWLVEPGLGE